MLSKTKGSYEGWNDIWSEQSEKDLLNPMFTDANPANMYQFWQQAYARDLIELIKNKNYSSFCELGSGRGTTTMYLARAGYTNLAMVDLAEQGFEVAKYSFRNYNLPQPEMILANVEDTPIPSASYDCIYNIGLLEHFENPKPTLKEAFRLLKSGGLIFMPIVPTQPIYKSFPSRAIFRPFSIPKIIIKKILGRGEDSNITRTEVRRSQYEAICKDLGYKNIKCIRYNPYWKLHPDSSKAGKLMFNVYTWHYNRFRKGRTLSMAMSAPFELCYLLIAEKE